MIIRGPSGLGDAMYMAVIGKYYTEKGNDVEICTKWADLYRVLGLRTLPHQKAFGDIQASYGGRKKNTDTNQYQDLCIASGIKDYPVFKIEWPVQSPALIKMIRKESENKKICIVGAPYKPFGRDDGFGVELEINYDIFEEIMKTYNKQIFFILTGTKATRKLNYANFDLVDQTSVCDLMDISSIANLFLTQVGHLLPIGECLGKPVACFFSKHGMTCENQFVNTIIPKKVFCRDTDMSFIDDEPIDVIIKRFGDMI